jgi:hypothetical protein
MGRALKTPPPTEDQVLALSPRRDQRDRRFLIFVGIALVAIALAFKSELIPAGQIWLLATALVVLSAPALFGYLSGESSLPRIEHFVPAALGAVAVAGLSTLVPEWWKYALIAAIFGLGFFAAGQLDYRQLREEQKPGHLVVQEALMALGLAGAYVVVLAAGFNLPLRLGSIFLISLLASYRSFRVLGRPMAPRRALLFSVFVAQVVSFFAWAMTALTYFTEGVFAVLLFLVWYVNRGIIRHTVEETLTRNVVIEYALFVLLIAYLFFTSFQPR